jgi:hypothetical protein
VLLLVSLQEELNNLHTSDNVINKRFNIHRPLINEWQFCLAALQQQYTQIQQ